MVVADGTRDARSLVTASGVMHCCCHCVLVGASVYDHLSCSYAPSVMRVSLAEPMGSVIHVQDALDGRCAPRTQSSDSAQRWQAPESLDTIMRCRCGSIQPRGTAKDDMPGS